jgi:hypothetical protein
MLPAMASMMAGGMQQQFSGGLGAAGLGANGNVFGKVIEEMMRQSGGRAQPQPEQAPQPSNNPWGDVLGQILKGATGGQAAPQPAPQPSGNPWGDVLDQILKGATGGQAAQPRRAPKPTPADNPFGKILEEMMKGGGMFGTPQADAGSDTQNEPDPQPRRSTPQPDSQSNNPWGDMFETGRKTQDSYQKGLQDIFDGFLKGMDRNQ